MARRRDRPPRQQPTGSRRQQRPHGRGDANGASSGPLIPPRGARLIALNKPYGVLCQFSGDGTRRTLADYVRVPDVYPAGRLDADSEGLVLLTNDGQLQARIANPRHKIEKTYWVQVEGVADSEQVAALAAGVGLKDGRTAPARCRVLPDLAALWPRDPPIRVRKTVPDSWLELVLREGRNRQVRRMTAAVGLPTLRLIRVAIGGIRVVRQDGTTQLDLGAWRDVEEKAVHLYRGGN